MLSIYKNIGITIILILFISVAGLAQMLEFKNVEKIELVTDRALYVSGETIWYTGYYSMSEGSNKALSSILYVELFDNDLKLVTSQKVEICDGLVSGKILITEQSITGYYILRAYTRYQENFPVSQMTSLVISIVNPTHPLPGIKSTGTKSNVSFAEMPDGSLAFGLHWSIVKNVKDVELIVNDEIVGARVRYFKNGIGSLDYKLKQNDNVKLLIKLNTGDTVFSNASKPYVVSSTVTTSIDSDGLLLSFVNTNLPDQLMHLSVIDIYGNEVFKNRFKVTNGLGTATILQPKLKSGIISVGLNDEDGNLISKSYHYIPECEKTKPIDQNKKTISPNNRFEFDIGDLENSDFPLSISFILDGTGFACSDYLPDYLIFNPHLISSYYGNNCIDSKIIHQVEIALALAGEKVFSEIVKQKQVTEPVIAELFGLTLQGSIVNPDVSDSNIDELIYSSVLGEMPQFHTARTSNDGRFLIPLNDFAGLKDVYIGTDRTNGSGDIEIIIDNGFCKEQPIWFSTPFHPDTSYRSLITQMYFNHQVVSLYDIQKEQTLENNIQKRPIFGDNLKKIVLSDYVQLASVPEVINEIVPNVRARKKDGNYNFVVLDEQLNIKYENPLLFVDQIPYYNVNALMELQPTEIEVVEVAAHKYMYGNELFNGIISITTNTGNFAGLPLSENGVFVEYKGLEDKVNYLPFAISPSNLSKPNYANTVYWNTISKKKENSEVIITAPSNIGNYSLVLYSLPKKKMVDCSLIQVE